MNAIEWAEWLDKDYGVAPCNKPELAGLLRRIHAENERLRAENEAMAKDAARLGFFVDSAIQQIQHGNVTKARFLADALDKVTGEYTLDNFKSAIDAAMEQSK